MRVWVRGRSWKFLEAEVGQQVTGQGQFGGDAVREPGPGARTPVGRKGLPGVRLDLQVVGARVRTADEESDGVPEDGECGSERRSGGSVQGYVEVGAPRSRVGQTGAGVVTARGGGASGRPGAAARAAVPRAWGRSSVPRRPAAVLVRVWWRKRGSANAASASLTSGRCGCSAWSATESCALGTGMPPAARASSAVRGSSKEVAR